jgi:hypothetical protein
MNLSYLTKQCHKTLGLNNPILVKFQENSLKLSTLNIFYFYYENAI